MPCWIRPSALRAFLHAQPHRPAPWPFGSTLDSGERETEGFGARIAGFEISPAARSRALRVVRSGRRRCSRLSREFLADPARPKIVHDPKLLELLAGPIRGIATPPCSIPILLRPTTAQHDLPAVVLAPLERRPFPARPESTPINLQRLAPLLRSEVEAQELLSVYEQIDLPLAPVLARWSATASASIPQRSPPCRDHGKRNPRARAPHLGTGRRRIQRQFAAATRRNPLRQDESCDRRQTQPRTLALNRRRCLDRARPAARIAPQSVRIPRTHKTQNPPTWTRCPN